VIAAFGRRFQSSAFEITEAVMSAPILAGCTWCTTALSASRMLVITFSLA